MDVFAFPSHEEPLGSVLLAAMAQGLPVVAIGRGGIPEVVENGKNGLLVNSLDPEHWQLRWHVCSQILKNRVGWAKPRAKPFRRVSPQITWWMQRCGSMK